MPERIKTVTLIKGDKISQNTDYRDALPQNMYAVLRKIFGAQGYMLCYPGLTKFCDGINLDRGAMYNERQKKHFRVSGEKLIEVNTDGSITELGDVPGTGQVEMAYSFNTQAIVADGAMFLYDPTNGFREVTDADLGSPIDIEFIDGYYFLTDGEYLYHTDLNDETSIDPLKYDTSEFSPDPTLGLGLTSDNKIMAFNRYTIEYFNDVSTANFAFSRIETRAQKIGIVGTHAKCEVNDKWYICGGRKESSIGIYILQSGFVKKISTREIDDILAQYTEPELSDVRLEGRVQKDVTFILVHLPSETLCFNETVYNKIGAEYAWTILKSGIRGVSNYRAINGIFDPRLGQWIYGDKQNQYIGILDNTVFTHYDEVNEWILYTPFIDLETMSIDQLDLETIPGHTTTKDAKVAISLSYDGLTFGKEWFEMYGLPSDYSKRFIIRRLGYVPSWIGFKFRGATRSRMAFSTFKLTYS